MKYLTLLLLLTACGKETFSSDKPTPPAVVATPVLTPEPTSKPTVVPTPVSTPDPTVMVSNTPYPTATPTTPIVPIQVQQGSEVQQK